MALQLQDIYIVLWYKTYCTYWCVAYGFTSSKHSIP